MGRVDYIKSLFGAILLAPRQAFDEILHALCCTLNFCLGKYNDVGVIFGGQLFHSVFAIEHKYYAGVESSFHLDIRHFFFLSPFFLLFSKQAGFLMSFGPI